MLIQTNKQKRNIRSYTSNNSLLVQFILSEFIAVHQLTKKLQTQTPLNTASAHALLKVLNQLLGVGAENERPATSRWTKGPLVKLHHYCRQLYVNGDHKDKSHSLLYHYVHKTWLIALHNWEVLHAYQTNEIPSSMLAMIQKSVKQLQTRLTQMAKPIARVVRPFDQDENVIFFLFRKKNELEDVFGADFIKKLLKLPPTELFQLLQQRLTHRGFDHLLPTIQHHLL